MKTTLEELIERYESKKHLLSSPLAVEIIEAVIATLRMNLSNEKEQIEKAFEDGVGEGLTDPERPFTGKEYFDVKYMKP